MSRLSARLLALILCASFATSAMACAGSMQNASTTSASIKRPVRASTGSVEQSPRK